MSPGSMVSRSVPNGDEERRYEGTNTITPSTRLPMGMAWAILTVMSAGAFMAGITSAKIGEQANILNRVEHKVDDLTSLMMNIDKRVSVLELTTQKKP